MNAPDLVWDLSESIQVPEDFARHIGGHPIVAETLYKRGITSIQAADAFLNPDTYTPANPYDLPDMDLAVERIKSALQNNEKIGIWGDFDLDGQTSTTLLVDALRQLGGNVIYHIPVRATESHGIKIPFLQTFLDQGVQLLITCDTGITAHDAIDYANSRDIPVIITDHHQLSPSLPKALAAVNPQRLPSEHPMHPLCGVGCAYEVIRALYADLDPASEAQTEQYLDLVTLGTIADVAELHGDNRWLVQRGLQSIREHPRKSVLALLTAADVKLAQLDEGHISFQIAPRLNALGRLGDANPIVDFFLSEDEQEIQVMTARLEGLNGERRFRSKQIFAAALSMFERDPHLLDFPVLVLGHPEWIGGVVGIVASHLVEIYKRPAILLNTAPGKPASGSARSIEGIDINRAITACQCLLKGFGGHPMAAGLSLDVEKIPEFRRMLSNAIRRQIKDRPLVHQVSIDAVIQLKDLGLELAKDINRLAPFGHGNPALNFLSKELRLKSHSLIGKTREHRKMIVEDKYEQIMEFLWWKSAEYDLPESPFDLAFNLRPSTFRGTEDIQLTWLTHLHTPEADESGQVQTVIPREIIDHRQHPYPLQALAEIQEQESSLIIWGEAVQNENVPAVDRQKLTPASALIVWTAPPSRDVLEKACTTVSPERIYLFNQQSSDESIAIAKDCIQTALAADGWLAIPSLAASSAQTEVSTQTLLDLFIAHGNLGLLAREGDRLQLNRGGTPASKEKISELTEHLKYMQGETQAYRRFYATAKVDGLINPAPQSPNP